MITVIQQNNTYAIKFPFDRNVIGLIKNVPGRQWVPESKLWTIPKEKLGFLIAQFKGTEYENQLHIISDENLNVNSDLGQVGVIPDIDISDVDFRCAPGLHPFKHQLDTLRYYKYRKSIGINNGFLLADQPGGAKTLSVTNVALYKRDHIGSKHCLIIACVNSAKYNWKHDIEFHTSNQEQPYILGSRRKRDGSINYSTGGKEKLQDLTTLHMYGKDSEPVLPYFIILNIEAVRYKEGRNYLIADRLIELIDSEQIDIIALDEVHHGTSMQSLQGKQILRIKKTIKVDVDWIPMTGTPIVSKPTDVFLPLRLVNGHYSNSYYSWCQEFCIYGGFGNHDIVGYKNIPKLKSMLEPNMLRRLKKDILDLPPKLEHIEYIENTDYQKKLYNKIRADLISEHDSIVKAMNPLAKLLRLRQVNGSPELVDTELTVDDKTYLSHNAKLQRLLELIEEITSNNEKVIIFSNWVEPLRTLYRFISRSYKVCCYTGKMNPDDREKHKQVFINNPNYKIMIGTVGALGTSHTLTVANNIIFYDEAWTPADMEQASDRVHRPGQTQTIHTYTLITKDTVDERVHDILYTKDGVSKYIVDNQVDIHNHPELLDMLLDINNKGDK